MTPIRPRLTLRLGFAGRKDLDACAERHLRGQLQQVLGSIAYTLAAIVPGVPVAVGKVPPIAQFYAPAAPLLRLVTGLCEGADAVAAEVLQTVRVCPDAGTPSAAADAVCVQTELAAVLPFAVADYRASRPASFLPTFDAQLARCAYVLELDGIYAKPSPDTPLAQQRRARAYRAQGAFLLRHCDVLVAAANPDDAGKAGGTLETLRAALAFELPVVLIHTGTGAVYLIDPEDDLHLVLSAPPNPAWQDTLQDWVRQIVADPDGVGAQDDGHGHAKQDEALAVAALREYFDQPGVPAQSGRRWGARLRSWAWSTLEKRYARGAKPRSDPALAPYAVYRQRATALNYHYSGLYRGAFVLNYALAVVAVVLATASLLLLGTASHTAVGAQIAQLSELVEPATMVTTTPQPWLLPALIGMGAVKLLIVIFIARNTRRANAEHWNDRAVDMRYLAERLRALYYLPRLGSFQPPAVHPPQYAARVVRQSHIDWLSEAIVRSISPADLADARPLELHTPEGASLSVAKHLRIDAGAGLQRLRDDWLAQQAVYHARNSDTMQALHHHMERWQRRLGGVVIGIVSADLVLIGLKLADKLQWVALPECVLAAAKLGTPFLIFCSAFIPALIAALAGLRFQSECQRLAERSAVMRRMLAGRTDLRAFSAQEPQAIDTALAQAGGRLQQVQTLHLAIAAPQAGARSVAADSETQEPPPQEASLGSYAYEALRLGERIAEDLIQEAAEWSVLYAKELGEPG